MEEDPAGMAPLCLTCVQSRDVIAKNHRFRIFFHQPYHLRVAKIPVTVGKFYFFDEVNPIKPH